MNKQVRDALEDAAVEFDQRAREMEENEEGVYTEDDIRVQHDRAAMLRSLADKGDLYQCTTCGNTTALPRFASTLAELCPNCNSCGTTNSLTKIPFTSGYDRPHLLNIWVRADMLETVGGYDEEALRREFEFALSAADYNDPNTLRWIAALAELRIRQLDVAAFPTVR